MARSLSNVRMFSAYFVSGIATAVPRRGYAVAAEAARGETVVSKAVKGRSNGTVKMRSMVAKEERTWIPDPKAGFYMPGNRRDEIDAAMLKRKDCAPPCHNERILLPGETYRNSGWWPHVFLSEP